MRPEGAAEAENHCGPDKHLLRTKNTEASHVSRLLQSRHNLSNGFLGKGSVTWRPPAKRTSKHIMVVEQFLSPHLERGLLLIPAFCVSSSLLHLHTALHSPHPEKL